MFGGEGCFNTELTGPGTIWLQSLSYEGLIKSLVRAQSKGPAAQASPAAGVAGGLAGAAFGAPPAEEMER